MIVNHVFAKPCHLVHVTEHGPALGLGQFNRARVEDAESVEREALGYKLLMYEGHHRYLWGTESPSRSRSNLTAVA